VNRWIGFEERRILEKRALSEDAERTIWAREGGVVLEGLLGPSPEDGGDRLAGWESVLSGGWAGARQGGWGWDWAGIGSQCLLGLTSLWSLYNGDERVHIVCY
jgi:hypothetical protein